MLGMRRSVAHKGDIVPPPMPDIQIAGPALRDLVNAANRAESAWNRTQLEDALRSVKHFVSVAEAAIEKAP